MEVQLNPTFEVEKDDGKTSVRKATHDGKGFKYTVVEETIGYMVYFPKGHSIRVRNDAELKRLGFHRPPRITDMTDQIDDDEPSLKALSDMKVKSLNPGRRSKSQLDEIGDE